MSIEKKLEEEISKSLISTAKMSTCCVLLELINNKETSGKSFVNFEKELLNLYNRKKSNRADEFKDDFGEKNKKKIKFTHFGSQIRLLKRLELIEENKLTSIGKNVASKCINGEYNRFVSYIFFRNMYKNSFIFREFIKKIREGDYSLDQILDEMEKLHGLNKYAINGLKSWSSSLNILLKLGTKVRIESWLEDIALENLSTSDLTEFLNSIHDESESIKENTLFTDFDLRFSNGTLSSDCIEKILKKLREDNIIYYNRGKSELIYIIIKMPIKMGNTSLKEYLGSN